VKWRDMMRIQEIGAVHGYRIEPWARCARMAHQSLWQGVEHPKRARTRDSNTVREPVHSLRKVGRIATPETLPSCATRQEDPVRWMRRGSKYPFQLRPRATISVRLTAATAAAQNDAAGDRSR
jgi:hypothetical protein